MSSRSSSVLFMLIPLAGMAGFVVLYFVAAQLYPGGSNYKPFHEGFDWLHNYWCDLIASHGKNGELNNGRPVALTAMIILFSSLSVFWFRLPDFFREGKFSRLLIGYTGMTAMFILVFIFTKYHDTIIFTGSILCAIPFIGTLWELYINRWRWLFLYGCLCLVFILFNFYSYLSGWLIVFLPLIQKITVAVFLGWIALIDWHCILGMRKSEHDSVQKSTGKTCRKKKKVNYRLDKYHGIRLTDKRI